MYGGNGLRKGWWKEVEIIIWGATALLSAENDDIKGRIRELISDGVKFSACRACAEQLGVVDQLEAMGVDVIYYGEPLTEILKTDGKLLTI